MAEFIVTNSGTPGGSGLTFEGAIQAAILSAGADVIRFDASVTRVEIDEAVSLSTEITIDGDHDGDGISDVVINAADNRHLNIEPTGVITIRNVDFVGGFDRAKTFEGSERLPASGGVSGTAGTLTPGAYVLDGADGNDDAGTGTNGSEGEDGVDAAGSIHNAGNLTLIRVGFGGNFASGEIGQRGGTGGPGGFSTADNGLTDYVTGLSNTGFGLDEDWRQFLLSDAHPGGAGGDGGRGGDGGNGGDGGDGGDAAGAILNEGSLTLIDTVFAGRLTSGTLGGGNNAYGGFAGRGGGGGYGGYSYGGDGGASGRNWFAENRDFYLFQRDNTDDSVKLVGPDDGAHAVIIVHTEETSEAGVGGDGGIPGGGGTGGRGGDSGDAATIINRGTLSGTAAIINDGSGSVLHNIAEVRDEGSGGFAGAAGRSFGGDGGQELGPFQSISFDSVLDLGTYRRNGTEPPEWVENVWGLFRSTTGHSFGDLPLAGSGQFTHLGYAADGVSLPNGPVGTAGQPGQKGTGTTGVGGTGSSSLQTNSSLVYAFGLGQDTDAGTVSFNIIRIGAVAVPITVSWTLTGFGDDPISAADFAPGTNLSGQVSFDGLDIFGSYDIEEDGTYNVRTVSFNILGDGIDEVPEGYVFTLTAASGTAILGTKTVYGTIVDDGASEEPGPILGTDGPDDMEGTDGDDDIRALGGDDEVEVGLGADRISLGTGFDTVKGLLAHFAGDTITDFSVQDELKFWGVTFDRSAITVLPGSAILLIDGDGDTVYDASITLEGDFSGGDFMAVRDGADTIVTFETFLPNLAERQAVDADMVNGINNQLFLTGDGSVGFQVTLIDMGFASFDNVLGVYEVDADGDIVDVQLVFANANADKSATTLITGVEAGHKLGFFIVQDAAEALALLSGDVSFAFVNGSDDPANVSDGNSIVLSANGTQVDAFVFHSFAAELNGDGVQHALSGVDVGGQSIVVGFEDLWGGGDRDYEDVVFRVEMVDV